MKGEKSKMTPIIIAGVFTTNEGPMILPSSKEEAQTRTMKEEIVKDESYISFRGHETDDTIADETILC